MADEKPTRSKSFLQAWQAVVGETVYRERRQRLTNPNAIDPDNLKDLDAVVLNMQVTIGPETLANVLRGLPAGDVDATSMADFIRRLWGDPIFIVDAPEAGQQRS